MNCTDPSLNVATDWKVVIRCNDDTYTLSRYVEAKNEKAANTYADRLADDLRNHGHRVEHVEVNKIEIGY